MRIEAQLVIVACDDYEWLFVNGKFVDSGHMIDKYTLLKAIHQHELDGSYATYEISSTYLDENGGDLPDLFEEVPTSELNLLSYADKRKSP
ncbi:hypothetical protein LC76P1_00179 [Lysinibacillus phage LC76P1]|nr:hypothetical protein LC76P1_00179 [Lysinibacillus phage LC76P1]